MKLPDPNSALTALQTVVRVCSAIHVPYADDGFVAPFPCTCGGRVVIAPPNAPLWVGLGPLGYTPTGIVLCIDGDTNGPLPVGFVAAQLGMTKEYRENIDKVEKHIQAAQRMADTALGDHREQPIYWLLVITPGMGEHGRAWNFADDVEFLDQISADHGCHAKAEMQNGNTNKG